MSTLRSLPRILPRTLRSPRSFPLTIRLAFNMSGAPANKMTHLKNINALPSQYPDFRTVLWTGRDSQLVVMTVPVDGDIGEEVSGRARRRNLFVLAPPGIS